MFVLPRAAWQNLERELNSPTSGLAASGASPASAERLDGSAILGPRAWLPEGADWTEVARGSPVAQDQVIAVHDGRFLAPASAPRLLCRTFEIPALPRRGVPSANRTILEFAPQLLLPRQADSDLALVQGKLSTVWSRGMVLERLVGSVYLESDEVLVLLPVVTSSMMPAGEGRGEDSARPGRVRTAPVAEPSRASGLGPDGAMSAGAQPFGPAGGPQPTEARSAPTIAELILAAAPEGTDGGPRRPATPRSLTRTLLVFEPVGQ